ncbi:MAG: GAF domain-containing protein [Firmicutes bacterium]|nr:GAF domain-containing protein [Bacillota bacterium]
MQKEEFYYQLNQNLAALLESETDWLANLANAAALLFYELENINWAGFYLLKDNELVLGPFQGKPACVRIAVGKGVCGSVAAERQTLVVPNVHQFPGHIACDPDSRSEIVVPIISRDTIRGVLDIDSPNYNRFDQVDKQGLEKYVKQLEIKIDWQKI